MAIYHLSAQIIGRGGGRSSTAAAAYRLATVIDDDRTGQRFDYSHKRGVDDWQVIGPEAMPERFRDPSQLWNAVEAVETRRDAQLCREINVALPRELSPAQNRALVLDWCQHFTDAGVIVCAAFHHLHGENPHAHLMLTLREIANGGFGNKVRVWNNRKVLEQWRETWAKVVNQHLARHEVGTCVDHRTLAAQGVERTPTQHQGPIACAMERRGVKPDRVRVVTLVPPLMNHAHALRDLARERKEPPPVPVPVPLVCQAMEAIAEAREAHRLAVAEEANRQQAAHRSATDRASRLQQAEADRKASHAAEQQARALKRQADAHQENIEQWKRTHRIRLWLWRHGVTAAIPDRVRKADRARAKAKKQAIKVEQMRHEADALALASWSKYTHADNADKHCQRMVREASAKVMEAAERIREAESRRMDITTPDCKLRQAKQLRQQQHTDTSPEALTTPCHQRGWRM